MLFNNNNKCHNSLCEYYVTHTRPRTCTLTEVDMLVTSVQKNEDLLIIIKEVQIKTDWEFVLLCKMV